MTAYHDKLITEEYQYRSNWDSFYAWNIKCKYHTNLEKNEVLLLELNVTAVSDQPVPDEVFTLSHYGLTEPEIVNPRNKFPWYLIIICLALVVVGVVARRHLNRRN